MTNRTFDIRTVERSLQKGKITYDEYKTYLSGLADQEDEWLEVQSRIDSDEDVSAEPDALDLVNQIEEISEILDDSSEVYDDDEYDDEDEYDAAEED